MPSVRLHLVAFALLLAASAAVTPGRPLPLLKQDVLIQADRFFIAFNRLDAAQTGEFLEPNATVKLADDPRVTGRANVIKEFDSVFAYVLKFSPKTTSLTYENGRFVQRGTFVLTFTEEDGRISRNSGSFRIVWQFFADRPLIMEGRIVYDDEFSRVDKQWIADVSIESGRYMVAYRRGYAAQVGRFYAPNATLEVNGGGIIRGRAQIVTSLAHFIGNLAGLEGETTSIAKIGDREYEEKGTYVALTGEEGKIVTSAGLFRFVWKFFGGRPVIIEAETM